MAKLGDKIKTALDESRILVLGTQILLGFQYRAVFESGFAALPPVSQYLKLAGLGVLLVGIILIIWPSAYHRIVYQGNDDAKVHEFITTIMDLALLPIVIALTLDFYVLSAKLLGTTGGVVVAIAVGFIGLFFLYGLALISRTLRSNRKTGSQNTGDSEGSMKTPIHKKVEHVLTEARVVLPGATALLGFQLSTMLLEAFDKLPAFSKYVHLVSLCLMGVSVVLLMTPAAYHRIAERGEETEGFHNTASKFLLAAMVTLPVGMCGDLFVVVLKLTQSTAAAAVSALVMLSLFYGLWFGFTIYRKSQLRNGV